MKTLTMFILLLGSLASLASSTDPYTDCTEKLEHKIVNAAKRHCLLGLRCSVIEFSLKMDAVMWEEQEPGHIWYVARITVIQDHFDDGESIYFKLKAYRSSEENGKKFYCKSKNLKQISEKTYENYREQL